jgi:hypothetical protein
MLSILALMRNGDLGQEQWFKLIGVALNGLLLFAVVTFSVRVLRTRMGGASAFYPLLMLAIFQAVIQLCLLLFLLPGESADQSLFDKVTTASSGTYLSIFAFPVGLAILILILLFRWRDLYRWLPRRQDSLVSRLESIFMLYTPARRGVLFFHIIFHVLLVLI